ncbi:hypothetical protein EDB80DRAFT_882925 [Ilyonectria destructans]|nr:hypothetical protein EDB80DRAFT_882925 [Ilyonectria destructans]
MASALPLPVLQILLKQENLEIVVTSSFCLDLPSRIANIKTIDQLLVEVKKSHLWIARTGNCHIEISVAVNDDPILENEQLDTFSRSIKHCDVWNRLGLRLEYERNTPTQLPGLTSFSIQHPDLASALAPPTGSATARFRALILSVNVLKAKAQPPRTGRQRQANKRKRPYRVKEEEAPPGASGFDEMSLALDLDDRLAVENFITSLNFASQSGMADQKLIIEEALNIVNNSTLVGVMLEQLMLAPSKKYRGIQVLRGLSTRCVTRLAPGVFHIPYLKTISDRTDFLKVIGTSLARMRNAESPGLRQKTTELSLPETREQTPSTEWDDIVHGIEKRAWDVLVTDLKLPPLKERARKGQRQLVQPESEGLHPDQGPVSILSPRMEENYFQVKQEQLDSSQGGLNVDESISANGSTLASNKDSLVCSQYFSPYSGPPFTQASEANTSTPWIGLDEDFMGNQDPRSGFGMTSDNSYVNYELPTQVESSVQFAGSRMEGDTIYDPERFQSLDDWLLGRSPGM